MEGFMKFIRFVITGYVFAMLIEFQFNILATGNIPNFIFTMFFYPVFLVVVYLTSKIIDKVMPLKRVADIIYYLLFGFVGLMLEWYMIGNSPWGNPDANQIGMWSFWVTLTFMPRIFTSDDASDELKKKIIYYFLIYAVLTTIIGFILPFSYRVFWLTWFEVIGYTAMNYFYVRYIIIKS